MNCRHCGAELNEIFIDLGSSPPSNAYLTSETLYLPEKWFPLQVLVCSRCWLVQTADFTTSEELFTSDYAYFSSYSSTWLAHAREYVDAMIPRFHLDESKLVIEIAANDGYLLQYIKERNIPCLGIEPTASTASAARKKGIQIIEDFFGTRLAQSLLSEEKTADLIIANNVLAHVPDINDFVSGVSRLLKPEGVATFEFPHLFELIDNNQFDTIYHEHYSYLSLISVKHIFEQNGLLIFDVESVPTHGGSLRVYATPKSARTHPVSGSVTEFLKFEEKTGMKTLDCYINFQNKANKVKDDFLLFLLHAQREGKKVAGYGAAAKGNTLINYAGIRPDLIPYVVDLNSAKTGKYLPGSRIPIMGEESIREEHPDYVIIFPWNLKEEIINQLSYIREWDGKFVVAIPELRIL